jgi:chromosomal replication initiation ATPase DnaA
MLAQMARNAAFAAGLALLSGCVVTQSQLDAQLNQRMSEMHSYVDQKVATSESATRKDLAAVKATTEAIRVTAEAILKTAQSQESDIRQNREALRNLLEAQSQALDQQKRTVDALIEGMKAAPPATQTAPMPSSPKTP